MERRVERRVSKSVAKNISRSLKPEARRSTTEISSWEAAEKILRSRVEGYPERFKPEELESIREFYQLRWTIRINNLNDDQVSVEVKKFEEETFKPNCVPAYRVILQILSERKSK